LAWAVPLVVVACSGTKVVERSAPERPAWVESAPAARDQLYFVGTCTDLPSYQEALNCARGEALTDVATWIGARFTSRVYSAGGESSRVGGATVYYDSELFLAEARRTDTYHEVRQEEWGRSYLVSVLITYPRQEAEAERTRVKETTVRSDGVVDEAVLRADSAASEGRWGEAMEGLVLAASEVALPHNYRRSRHLDRLADMAEELVAPLQLGAASEDGGILVRAAYEDAPAAGVPVACFLEEQKVVEATDGEGRAVCKLHAPESGEPGRAVVRSDIDRYLDVLPAEAGGLAKSLGSLMDRTVRVDVGARLDVVVALIGGRGCEAASALMRERLARAGVRVTGTGRAALELRLTCSVEGGASSGELFTASARSALVLEYGDRRTESATLSASGLGSTETAARREALKRLGAQLGDAALKLIREHDAESKI
jgi:hypothetical protein